MLFAVQKWVKYLNKPWMNIHKFQYVPDAYLQICLTSDFINLRTAPACRPVGINKH